MKEKEELSKLTDIQIRTLYNWEEKRPKLYKFLINCMKKSKSEIEELFEQLDEEEQEMYLTEMRARVLRKKIDGK